MKLFWKREAKSQPLTAISDLRAAQWTSAGMLAREGFERNAVVYRRWRSWSRGLIAGRRGQT